MFKQAFEVRDKIKDVPELAPWLTRLRETAAKLRETEPKQIMLSDFIRYYEDGDRGQFEEKYFDRRGRLTSYALMVFIYRDMSYLCPLEDIIWLICEETTWVLPAHIREKSRAYRHLADLFCAETGGALAEINYLLTDALSPRIRERIRKEVRERIIDTYLDADTELYWYHYTDNWVSVCAGSCTAACIYEGTSAEAKAAIAKSERLMEQYISGFSDDGMCLEGYAYWNYGFGYFLYYADLVREYTDGKINHFDNPKVRRISKFINIGQIRPGAAIAFADGDSSEGAIAGMEHFLSAHYPEIMVSDGQWKEYDYDRCYHWAILIRNAVWTAWYRDKISAVREDEYGTEIYYGAQWYIKKTPLYILCAKGGNNDELHNQNDVGSFYVDNYSTQIFADFGWCEYTRDYFDNRYRYDIFVCGSQGHNLPIINGHTQPFGAEYRAEIKTAEDNVIAMEIAGAYNVPELESFLRTIKSSDDEITVHDSFCGTFDSITERFVSSERPCKNGKTIKIQNVRIECGLEPKIQRIVYKSHDFAEDTEAWTIDYVMDVKCKTEFELKIKFFGDDK